MIHYLLSSNDVLAVRIRNGIGRAELDDLIERLQQKIDRGTKTHVFVDIDEFRSEDWRSALESLPHSMGLLRLNRYGRIAVVSDDSLVRGWSRLESAMLPGVHYEIFHADEADRALGWVEGKFKFPHAPALRFLQTDNPLVLAYEIDGTLTKTDLDQAIATLKPRLERELGPISVLARVGELLFSEPAGMLSERYFHFKKATLARVERYAIVGGPLWLQMLVKATAPFVHFDLRHFDKADEEAAWKWVGGREQKVAAEVSALTAETMA
jgi:hypothetical protein